MAIAATVRKLADSARSSSSPLNATLTDGSSPGIGAQPGLDRLEFVVGQNVGFHIGLDIDDTHAVDAMHQGQLRLGGAFDEVAERDRAARDRDAQLVEFADVAHLRGEARDDVDLVVGIVRPVVAELEAAGHQLDHVADRGDVEAVFGRFGAIDVQLPFDAGDRPRILDVHQARHGLQLLAHDVGGGLQRDEIGGGQLDRRPACRRSGPPSSLVSSIWMPGIGAVRSRISSRMTSTLRLCPSRRIPA